MDKITVIFFCSWKFALTFPVAVYGLNMSFADVLIYTNIGGIVGVLFFTYLWHNILIFWNNKIRPLFRKNTTQKKRFTPGTRRFIKIKNAYGFFGIAALNPIIISIPISTLLVVKFYGRNIKYLIGLITGQVVWSFIYAFFYLYIKTGVFNN